MHFLTKDKHEAERKEKEPKEVRKGLIEGNQNYLETFKMLRQYNDVECSQGIEDTQTCTEKESHNIERKKKEIDQILRVSKVSAFTKESTCCHFNSNFCPINSSEDHFKIMNGHFRRICVTKQRAVNGHNKNIYDNNGHDEILKLLRVFQFQTVISQPINLTNRMM